METKQCECCGKHEDIELMIIDSEDANWYYPECVEAFKESEQLPNPLNK